MSVFTIIDQLTLERFLQQFEVGDLVKFQGIQAGVTDTNYHITTTLGQYVLTLPEQLDASQLPFFINLIANLKDGGLPCAKAIADKHGRILHRLRDKPALLVPFLPGKHILKPGARHIEQIGDFLGCMHTLTDPNTNPPENSRGTIWQRDTLQVLLTSKKLPADICLLLQEEGQVQQHFDRSQLPHGIIHADLFRDNVLFQDDKLTAVLDFNYACQDQLLLDLAIVANDWCLNTHYHLDTEQVNCLLDAYQQHRPLTEDEKQAWPLMLRAAAWRFWLSRLYDQCFPPDGQVVSSKDPTEFQKILELRRSLT